MNYSKRWKQLLSKKFGLNGNTIIQTAQINYLVFTSTIKSPDSKYKKLQEQKILSVAAIYLALNQHLEDAEKAYKITELLVREGIFQSQIKGVHLLNIFPDPYPIVRPMLKMMIRFSEFPNEQEIIMDDRNCFAANTYYCYIYDTLKNLGIPEITSIFCASDDWLSAAMPKVSWLRTQTIANGGDFCDFKWCRKK